MEIDEEFFNKYIDNKDKITEKILISKIRELFKTGKLFPMFLGSALKNIGTDELVSGLEDFFVEYTVCKETFSGYVYMIRNENKQRNLFIKILSGSLKIKDSIKLKNNKVGKINKIYKVFGSELINVDEAYAGEIVIVNGLEAKIGDYIGEHIEKDKNNFTKTEESLYIMEIDLPEKERRIELVEALKIFEDEDPEMKMIYDNTDSKIYLNLRGLMQAEIIKELMQERFGIKIKFLQPIIKLKETPTVVANGSATYTQFSAIEFMVAPRQKR